MVNLVMVQDNDDELLDLVTRTGGDLSQKRPITGSSAKAPVADSYTKEELKGEIKNHDLFVCVSDMFLDLWHIYQCSF